MGLSLGEFSHLRRGGFHLRSKVGDGAVQSAGAMLPPASKRRGGIEP